MLGHMTIRVPEPTQSAAQFLWGEGGGPWKQKSPHCITEHIWKGVGWFHVISVHSCDLSPCEMRRKWRLLGQCCKHEMCICRETLGSHIANIYICWYKNIKITNSAVFTIILPPRKMLTKNKKPADDKGETKDPPQVIPPRPETPKLFRAALEVTENSGMKGIFSKLKDKANTSSSTLEVWPWMTCRL